MGKHFSSLALVGIKVSNADAIFCHEHLGIAGNTKTVAGSVHFPHPIDEAIFFGNRLVTDACILIALGAGRQHGLQCFESLRIPLTGQVCIQHCLDRSFRLSLFFPGDGNEEFHSMGFTQHGNPLGSTVLEGCQVIVSGIYRLTGPDAQHGFIAVGPKCGDDQCGQSHQHDNDQAQGSDFVAEQPLHTVFEEGGGGPHLYHVRLFIFSSRLKVIHVHVETERFLFHFGHLLTPG